MRVIGVIALGLALSGAATAASGRPAVRVTDLTPFTVHGYRFDSGERLRLVITTKRRVVRTLSASGRGTFVLRSTHPLGRPLRPVRRPRLRLIRAARRRQAAPGELRNSAFAVT